VSGQRHTPTALLQGKTPGTSCRGGRAGLGTCLAGLEKSCTTGVRTPDPTACSKVNMSMLNWIRRQ